MGKVLRNRTLNKYLTLFNKERVVLLYTFANVIKMKCIILILNGYRYYGVILVFITIWYSYYFISLLRKRYWDIKAISMRIKKMLTSSVYCESGIETWLPREQSYSLLLTSSVYCESGIETVKTTSLSATDLLHQSTAKAVLRHDILSYNLEQRFYFISLLRKRYWDEASLRHFEAVLTTSSIYCESGNMKIPSSLCSAWCMTFLNGRSV